MVKIDKKQIALRFILSLVVAWIIIQILMLPGPGPLPTFSTPDEIAEDILNSINSSPYQEKYSDKVVFGRENTIVSAQLASETGLEKEQICLSIEKGLTGFKVENNSLISYSGDSVVRVQLAGICAPKQDFVSEDFIEENANKLFSRGFDFVDSGCASTCLDDQRCCVLFLYNPEKDPEPKPECGEGTPKTKECCEAVGGDWGRIGLNPEKQCNLPTSDAGKECSDGSECEGECLADLNQEEMDRAWDGEVIENIKGKCSEWKLTVGCLAFVEQGIVQIICYD